MATRRFLPAGCCAIALCMLGSSPAMAQVQPGSQEFHAYAGQLFGDDLTDTAISGKVPELDDEVTFGVRYGYNFTKNWGLELSLGQTPTTVTGMSSQDLDLDLTTLDVDAVYHFDLGSRWVPYVVAGIGYATADLERPILGTVGAQPVRLEDEDGFTANAGAGIKFFATDRVMIRAEARYRYIDALVSDYDDSLNTVETTLGIGWRF